MQVRRFFVGIDVSRDTLDVTVLEENEKTVHPSSSYENNPAGWAQLVGTLDSLASGTGVVQCAMESTGRYHEGVAQHLRGHNRIAKTVVLNPLAVKRFGQAMLKDTKTDKADSRQIALYLIRMKPEPTFHPEPELQTLQEATRRRRRLVEDRSSEKNRLHASLHRHYPGYQKHLGKRLNLSLLTVLSEMQSPGAIVEYSADKLARISTAKNHTVGKKLAEKITAAAQQAPVQTLAPATELIIRTSAQRILDLDKLIKTFDSCIKPIVRKMPFGKLLLSMPGLGPVTVATVLSEVGDIRHFPTADKFVGYCGLYPVVWESGQAKRSYSMSRKGNRWLKTALLVVTGAAGRFNPILKRFRERLLQRGKSKKAVGGAMAAKLARIIWAMMTKNQFWSDTIAQSGLKKADSMLASGEQQAPAAAV